MSNNIGSVPITGYANHLSVRAGEEIEFKVSSTSLSAYRTRLTQVISGDPNPEGLGVVEIPCDEWYTEAEYPSTRQPFSPGSYAISDDELSINHLRSFTFGAQIWLRNLVMTKQVIISLGSVELGLTESGIPYCQVAGQTLALSNAIPLNTWIFLDAVVNLQQQTITLRERLHYKHDHIQERSDTHKGFVSSEIMDARFCVAAQWFEGKANNHFTGKVEAPYVQSITAAGRSDLVRWDFSREISSTRVVDIGPSKQHGRIVNYPTRGVTGSAWNGEEMCWRHRPEHYAAIHFHADDIYDFGWETDFTFQVPENMPSGIYAMHLESDQAADSIPFVVCAKKGTSRAKLCVIIPTFTYAIYGNHARPDYESSWEEKIHLWGAYPHNPVNHQEYGLSTYNNHLDGSGVCHASHLRPLFNLRPGYLTFGYGEGSGLRHLQADSHLISWLHHHEIGYDLLTDHVIHEEGFAALAPYQSVMTTTHPEYHTHETLDGIREYTSNGGNLMYLGGNGFYWRIALHPENPDILEIRRAEDGIRAWAAEPGEYYSAFDGRYGGLWRRLGRPPQELVGVGFTAQGNFHGSYYRRKNYDPELAWVFDGIDHEVIGDHGFSGGGAAGYELDRIDYALGTPSYAVILASSEGHEEGFIVVPEEQLTHLTNTAGQPADEIRRADMVYFSLPNGGQVFSVGSITFCGSLPTNQFENDISTLLKNVLSKFID